MIFNREQTRRVSFNCLQNIQQNDINENLKIVHYTSWLTFQRDNQKQKIKNKNKKQK